jgi:outer membrane protein assembly factor BamB
MHYSVIRHALAIEQLLAAPILDNSMFRKRRFLILGVLIFVCLAAYGINRLLLPAPAPKWKVHVGSTPNTRIDAPVEVANGTVFVAAGEPQPGRHPWGEYHYLQALNASDGRFKWHMGVRGTSAAKPIHQDGLVIFSSVSFAPLYGVDAATGVPKWQFSASGDWPSTPVVKDGVVYMTCACRRYAGLGPNGRVLAIDMQSGNSKWEIDLENPMDISPAVTSDTVYYVDGDGLHAVDREMAKERWVFLPDQVFKQRITTAPVVEGDMVYFGAPADGLSQLFALDAKTGTERWRLAVEHGVIETVTVIHNTAYVSAFTFCDNSFCGPMNHLYAIDIVARQFKWRFDDASREGLIEDNGIIYFSSGRTLYAVDGATGRTKWTIAGDQYWEAPTLADGIVYIGGDKGDLYAIPVR